MPAALTAGFISDIATFHFINFETALTILLIQLFLAGVSIFFSFFEIQEIRSRFFSYARVFSPLILQYALGSVFSASVIFYSYSGSLSSSWPFIFVLVLLMISNEILKKYYTKPIFVLSVYFFAIFSFILLIVPYTMNRLGSLIFVSSGVISLVIISIFIYLLQIKFSQILKQINLILVSILLVFGLMNFFYFTNIIPPFPLSLQDIGVYHSVEKTSNGNYNVLSEKQPWQDFLFPRAKYQINSSGQSAYVLSSVFAPAKLNLQIFHEWQYKDPQNGKWQNLGTVAFEIIGGRKEGYREYSEKTNITPGKWRVNVKTLSGQIIGRISFLVSETSQNIQLLSQIK